MAVQEKLQTVCLMQIERDELLHALKQVSGAVEQSQVMQILSYVLLTGDGENVSVMASNSEVEVQTCAKLFSPSPKPFSITVSCRKLMDICRALPPGSTVALHEADQWIIVRSTDAQFRMATLPAQSFPRLPEISQGKRLTVMESSLKINVENTCFSMACQDARFFLNGLFLTGEGELVNCVATDGHRLSWCKFDAKGAVDPSIKAIIPRKTVLELAKLLRAVDKPLEIMISDQAIEVCAETFMLKSNLIEGQYPKFQKLIPTSIADTASVQVQDLKQALDKVAILANEKFKGARFYFDNNLLKIVSSNFDQEEAESSLAIAYEGKSRSAAFNINYLIDVLAVIDSEECTFQFSDSAQGVLIESQNESAGSYVVMPLTL